MNSKVLRISRARTLEALSKLRGEDPEREHLEADKVIVEHLKLIGETDVAQELEKTAKRCRFYFA